METQEEAQLARAQLEELEGRAFKTYECRVRAADRLAGRNRAWNAFLISTSTASAIASVGLLSDESMYGKSGPTVLVGVTIMTLVASLVTSGLDYSGRSRNMFVNYRKIQRLSSDAQRWKDMPEKQNFTAVTELARAYDSLLDESENHTEVDYYRAYPSDAKPRSLTRERLLTLSPYASLVLPAGIVVPFIVWIA